MSNFLGWKSKEAKAGEPFKPDRSKQTVDRAKWDRCVKDVKGKGVDSPYAICTVSVGKPTPCSKSKEKKAHKPKGLKKSAHAHLAKRIKDHVARAHSLLAAKKETEQTTARPQLVRGKESAAPKLGEFLEVGGRFLEKKAGDAASSARVVLIQEGLGNLKDGYYYTAEALKQAADSKIFEGKKMYADHPSKMEEAILPERSTRDIVGHYEDVAFEEAEDGTGMLTANLLLMSGDSYSWVQSLVKRAVDYSKKYGDKQFIGLSINASGEAEPMDAQDFLKTTKIADSAKKKVEDAILEGLNEVKVVRSFQDAVSVDIVTEAGARGIILELLEAEKMAKKNEAKKESESESKESEHESKESGHGKESENHHEDDGSDDHDDEDQDKALILQMLKKQGLVDDDDDGTSEACHEAMEMGGKYMAAYKAAGHKAAEAAHRAAEAMKCAADVHAAAAHKSKDDGDDGHEDDDGDDKPAKQKEANAVIELKAEVARLRESVRKSEIEKYLDKKLKESGLPVHVTKLFRESVANAKTQKEIDRGFDTFMKVYKLDRKEDFVESIEKNISNSNAKQVSSLDDCVETF